jgi:hypothetical protein
MPVKSFYRFLRSVTYFVLFFFCWTYLELFQIPVAFAASSRAAHEGLTGHSIWKKTEGRFQERLDRLRGAGADRVKLRAERSELEQLDRSLQTRFKETESAIKNLPSVIRQRHRAFTKKYSEAQSTLRSHFDSIDKAKTDDEVKSAAENLATFLESVRPVSRHQTLDRNNLPFKIRNGSRRTDPRLRNEEFERDFPQPKRQSKKNIAGIFDFKSAIRNPKFAMSHKPILLALNDIASDVPFTLPLPSGERTEVGTTC